VPPSGVATLAYFCQRSLKYIIVLENLRQEGGSEIYSTASVERKTHRERKLFGRQKSAREIPSRRGEIVTIVFTIERGIIIFITIIISTFIFTITMPSRCHILS
jgi:hypothetical protein